MQETKSIWMKILHFPLTKIIIGFIVIGITLGLIQSSLDFIFDYLDIDKEISNLITAILTSVGVIFVYRYLYQFYETRNVTELSTNKLFNNLGLGLFVGVLLQSLTIFVMYLYGYFSVVSVNSIVFILPSLAMAFSSGIIEEVLFRGILFRLVEEKLGSYIALFISGLLFGLIHYSNPNSSLDAALGLAIQAGLLLGAAYIYTRNLWFPIALHFAWNFTQSGIYGASTSGHSIKKSLLTTKIDGAAIITGGAFGPEGSIQATIFCLIATIILLVLSHKKKAIIKPFWK